MLTRRDFIAGTAGVVGAVVIARPGWAQTAAPPTTDLKTLIAVGLDAARAAGASWADVRFERIRQQMLRSEDDHIVQSGDSESWGVGIRAIVDGAWGFSATWHTDADAIAQAARDAVAIGRANAKIVGRKVVLAPTSKAIGKWSSPFEIDPFTVPLGERVDALLTGARAALAVTGAKLKVRGSLHFTSQEKTIGNSEGAYFEQRNLRGQPMLDISAIDLKSGQFESGNTDSLVPAAQVGFESLRGRRFEEAGVRAAEETIKRLGAQPVEAGTYDLVIAPSNLWLTIHESIGHPTELDRMLGYEANFAGTSFAKLSDLGKLKYGSPLVNVVADRTQKHALATVGWDDDGQPGDKWDLIKKGLFVGVQTTREQASWIHQKHGHAGDYAESWSAVPFQRMPNVSLQPGTKKLTPDELIADTKRGIYVEGRGSWSIDHQRYNFQFGGQQFRMIENGKLTRPLRYVAYQSNSVDFWRSLDALCDARDYFVGGALNDGKGEPVQSNPVSHGCVTSRFRGVRVINVRA
ncbi:MAG: peptidase modulator of gyrase [Myxococcales bacterium]|nr:peptidase modulator of gyrase [Myxococcales bacterium]